MKLFKKLFSNELFIVLILIFFSIPLILPYFKEGYFPTHDGEWAVVRLADMFRTLRDFQFPARYSGALNFGYGYPLFNFAYPGPYYFGIPIYFLTGSFVISIKALFALSVPLSAIFMYFASKKIWGSKVAGLISGIFYIYLPYRLVDLYVRGSIGEALSFVLFPLILLLSLRLLDGKNLNFLVPLLSLSIAALVITHNIMTVLFMPVLVVIILARIIQEKNKKGFISFCISMLLALLLSSFFWLPAIFEKSNIALSQIPIADRTLYFVKLAQVILPSWGYAPPTETSGFTYQLGLAQVTVLLTGLFYLLFNHLKNVNGIIFPQLKVLISIWLICFALMFSFTSFIWESLPLLSEINYPWTLLSQLAFVSSLIAGSLWYLSKQVKFLALGIVILLSLSSIIYAKPEKYNFVPDQSYLTNQATTTSSDELMPLWVDKKPISHFENKAEIVSGIGEISEISYNSKTTTFLIDSATEVGVVVNTIYYPGWILNVGGNQKSIDYDNEGGLISFALDEGRHEVELKFTETPLRVFSNSLSILAFIMIMVIISMNFRKLIFKQ